MAFAAHAAFVYAHRMHARIASCKRRVRPRRAVLSAQQRHGALIKHEKKVNKNKYL
jgi:hypothetical protein